MRTSIFLLTFGMGFALAGCARKSAPLPATTGDGPSVAAPDPVAVQ